MHDANEKMARTKITKAMNRFYRALYTRYLPILISMFLIGFVLSTYVFLHDSFVEKNYYTFLKVFFIDVMLLLQVFQLVKVSLVKKGKLKWLNIMENKILLRIISFLYIAIIIVLDIYFVYGYVSSIAFTFSLSYFMGMFLVLSIVLILSLLLIIPIAYVAYDIPHIFNENVKWKYGILLLIMFICIISVADNLIRGTTITSAPDTAETLFLIFLFASIYAVTFVMQIIINAEMLETKNRLVKILTIFSLIFITGVLLYETNINLFFYDPNQFETLKQSSNIIFDMIYFTIINVTTVGFGDIAATGMYARGVSIVSSIVGFLFVTSLLSVFVNTESKSIDREAIKEELKLLLETGTLSVKKPTSTRKKTKTSNTTTQTKEKIKKTK